MILIQLIKTVYHNPAVGSYVEKIVTATIFYKQKPYLSF